MARMQIPIIADNIAKGRNIPETILNVGINLVNTKISPLFSRRSEITLTNNEIKDIMRVIKPLENRGIFFKGITRKLVVKKKDFSIFLHL